MNKYMQDIEFLIEKLEEIPPSLYHNTSKKVIEDYIKTIENNLDINDLKFYYHIQRILKLIGDSHTNCFYPSKIIPLKLKLIDDKILVIATSSKYQKYLHNEIVAINGISIIKIIEELEKTIVYATNDQLEATLEDKLIEVSSILSLANFDDYKGNELSYTFQNKGENIVEIFNLNENFDYEFLENRPYWSEYDPNTNILIINYKLCLEMKEKPILDFVDELDELVTEKSIENVIVDLRSNAGGNSEVIKPLIKFLKEKKLNIVSLIDRKVYSSGRWAVVDLQNIGSKFVSTEIGTTLNSFGNTSSFILPNSKIRVNCSQNYWYYENGQMKDLNKEEFKTFFDKSENQKFLNNIEFKPDFYVENSLDDYLNDFDSELEAAKRYFNV